jgi:hypothetical protein
MSEQQSSSASIDMRELVGWLEQTLVPVPPNPNFVRRLRGRIVTYERGDLPSQWTLLFLAVVTFALIAASLGMAFRLLIALLGLLGVVERQKQDRRMRAGPA